MADKLEENAEELVELLLKAARAGEWRVVGMMWDRVFGRPKETVEHQTEEPEAVRACVLSPPSSGWSSGVGAASISRTRNRRPSPPSFTSALPAPPM